MPKSPVNRRPSATRPPVNRPKRATGRALNNAEIAHRLSSLAQLLATQRENPFKVKAYRRAAATIASLPDSIDALVRRDGDLTVYSGIGKGIASAVREIVLSGNLQKLETLRTQVRPELAALSEYPRLDPKRALQAYKSLRISSLEELKTQLENGEADRTLSPRLVYHLRDALNDAPEILLYEANDIVRALQAFLLAKCQASRAEPTGDFRRRVEVIGELSFLIETSNLPATLAALQRFGGGLQLVDSGNDEATFKLPSGMPLHLKFATAANWGIALLAATGSAAHVRALAKAGLKRMRSPKTGYATEAAVYHQLGLPFIEPELREGQAEIALAARGRLPRLLTVSDLRGDLHAHTTSSDGAHSLEQMASAARDRGYDYLGITDHSKSLKIAGGVSEVNLWRQIKRIDRLNAKLRGIRLLKSAEVDILVDGTLDYPDELLRELDYVVCSIHSRFALNRAQQTARILRAMDNPHFTILGHATGRRLLSRPGYEIDLERIIAHAKARGCFFEINSSPERLDLSATHARLAHEAGVKIAVCTDAHSISELDFIHGGIEQARRAGLDKASVLNCLSLAALMRAIRRA